MDMVLFAEWLTYSNQFWNGTAEDSTPTPAVKQLVDAVDNAARTQSGTKYNFSYLEDAARYLMDEWYNLGLPEAPMPEDE